MEIFEAAMRKFNTRDFAAAQLLFEQASKGGDTGVAHRARLQATICARQLEKGGIQLSSAEDHYNYAVAQMGQRTLRTAQEHLRIALLLEPAGDHVLYALALCEAMAGNIEASAQHLRMAIELRPSNRIAAKQDADFMPYLGQPQLAALLLSTKPA